MLIRNVSIDLFHQLQIVYHPKISYSEGKKIIICLYTVSKAYNKLFAKTEQSSQNWAMTTPNTNEAILKI